MTFNIFSLFTPSLASPVKSVLSVGAVCLSLSACTGPDSAPPTGQDYRANHPITVEREQISISFENDLSSSVLKWADVQRLNRFLGDYVQRGRGPVIVEGSNALAAQDTLLTSGLVADEIQLMDGITDSVTILTFSAYSMKAPVCGDWSGSSSYMPDNPVHSNYGCSIQRNLGLMLSDPGDWVRSQVPGSGPLGRSDSAVDGINAPVAAEPAATQ